MKKSTGGVTKRSGSKIRIEPNARMTKVIKIKLEFSYHMKRQINDLPGILPQVMDSVARHPNNEVVLALQEIGVDKVGNVKMTAELDYKAKR